VRRQATTSHAPSKRVLSIVQQSLVAAVKEVNFCRTIAFSASVSDMGIYRQPLTNESISGYSPGRCAEVDNDSVQLLKCSSEYVLHGLPYALWQF